MKKNVSLSDYSTMRLGGKAKFLWVVENNTELENAVKFSKKQNIELHVIGGGSNSIFTDDGFDGLIIVNKIPGLEVDKQKDFTEITIGSGEKWDDVVAKSVELGYTDIAALSLIPGSMGAAPVQNIGAYGQQISDSLISVDAFDLETNDWITILRQDCNFSYRTSRFNQEDKGRFIITSVKLRLSRKTEKSPFYTALDHYFTQHEISTVSVDAKTLRKATIAIRQAKLPDPEKIANTGSFFKNPVISKSALEDLRAHYPQLKAHETDDGKLKLYAGQLIELAGMKNYHDKQTGMSTWKNQALVLVNENAKTTSDLLAFKQKIITSVHASFGITLEQEPELVNG